MNIRMTMRLLQRISRACLPSLQTRMLLCRMIIMSYIALTTMELTRDVGRLNALIEVTLVVGEVDDSKTNVVRRDRRWQEGRGDRAERS